MSHFRIRRCVALAMVAGLLAPAALPQGMKPARESGSAFQCEDGTKLELAFDLTGNGLDVLVTLRGAVHRLPYMEPEPGPTQVVWSDGERSLTWSPGVKLMWMASDAHLMCGRGGHQH